MLKSMSSAIAGMKAQQTNLDVIANNIANVGTTAFKASTVNFSDTLYQTSSQATAANANTGGTNAKSVGVGSQVSSINKLMSNGNSLTTGRTLDLDIDGDGYFIATTGAITGNITVNTTTDATTATSTDIAKTQYTRNGNLSLDADGSLVTASGDRIMGYYATGAGTTVDSTGAISIPTRVDPDTAAKPYITEGTLSPLAIPSTVGGSAVESFAIGTDGVITATTSAGKCVVGQIAMATFKNPEGLEDAGNSYQQESSNSGSPIISSGLDTTATNNSSAFGSMQSGYLEASNVDLTQEFTNMITATRSFEAASKMISNGDEILQTITGLIR